MVHDALQQFLSFFKISCHRYLQTRRPNTLITYTFFPQTIPANSMIMKPPSYVKNPHLSYYISVSMNCFTPSSYITTIRRDGWEGEMIGDFEYGINEGFYDILIAPYRMGISACRKHNTVCFRGYERPISEVLESSSKIFRGVASSRISIQNICRGLLTLLFCFQQSYLWKRHFEDGPVDLYWEESTFAGASTLSASPKTVWKKRIIFS